ncbi:hypothetical protein BC835DRAFT_1515545 [Cytidiella melzeri]|nr:hypothetical protein BC835DRAFT_1515545 [Cytidiella melzeri]
MQAVLSTASVGDPTLRKLDRYRKRYLEQPQNIAQRAHQQRLADNASNDSALQQNWFQSMKEAFREMDDVFKLTDSPHGFQFLDVGCCPGGFASSILEANPRVTGTGLSLEVFKGGHEFLLEDQYQIRFELFWGDINKYQLGYRPIHNHVPLPISPVNRPSGFALILLDGHPLRTAVDAGQATSHVHSIGDRLLISQLIIGLTTVTRGGTIIVKLSRPERLITSQLMWMFDMFAHDVRTWKPVCIHATRGTFYLIARGMGYGELAQHAGMYDGVLLRFKELWDKMASSGRRLLEHDLDFIVQRATLEGSYARRLRQLSAHLWAVQEAAWKAWRQQVENGF